MRTLFVNPGKLYVTTTLKAISGPQLILYTILYTIYSTHTTGTFESLSSKIIAYGPASRHYYVSHTSSLKGLFAKNERGYRLNALKKRF